MTIRILIILSWIGLLAALAVPGSATAAGRGTEAISVQPVASAPSRRVYFYDPSGDEERLLQLQTQLLASGAYHVNVFLPSTVVCMLPDEVSVDEFTRGGDLVAADEREPGIQTVSGADSPFGFYRECYDLARRMTRTDEEDVRAMRESSGGAAVRDSVAVLNLFRSEEYAADGAPAESNEGRRIFQDSEFMVGRIMLNLILPESIGWDETWSIAEIDEAIKGALAGIIYYQEQFSTAPIDYIVRTYRRVRTNYEPVYTRFELHESWVKDVMKTMGYVYYNFSGPRVVHEFHNVMRERYGADWIFTAFIISAQSIYNHQIVLTDFVSYSVFGGPYCIVPFPSGPYGEYDPSYMLSCHMQHATGHIFWALDEADDAKPRVCSVRSGYLNYINGSKIEGYILGFIPVNSCVGMITPCVMADPDWGGGWVCYYTAGQMGLIDANENNVVDVFDSDPIVEFEGGESETLVVDTITVRGVVRSVPIPNRNFQQDTTYWNHYASPLKDAVMDINGFGNLYLLAEDGRWDELEEEIVIPLTDLPVGLTSVELYIRNTAGCKSPARVKKIFRAGLSYTLYSAVCRNDGIALSWYMVGETFNARFALYRIDLSAAPYDTTLIAGDLQPSGEPEDQFLPFSYCDRDVEPAHTYGYFVRGRYTLAIQGGEPREFISDSKVFKGTAILPIPEGELLSRITPNPFRTSTRFSVLVPKTIEGGTYTASGPAGAAPASGLPWEVPTRLEAVVYDVMGRRVKTIVREERYGAAIVLEWDGTSDAGERVPSGIYFLRVTAGTKSQVRKVAVLR